MFTPRSPVAATAKDPYLVDKIAFLQNCNFTRVAKIVLNTEALEKVRNAKCSCPDHLSTIGNRQQTPSKIQFS
jgi:hypothetical protein